jgi:hypothetical protein
MHFYMLISSSHTFQLKFYEMRKFIQNNRSRFETQVCMFFCSLYNDAVSNLIYVALNKTEVSNAVFETVLKEAIVIYCKLISRNLPQGNVENFDNPQLEF